MVILSSSCVAVGDAVYCMFWLLHGATFVIITKFNLGQMDFSVLALLLLLLLLPDSPGVSEKFTTSTLY
jgi:hypothetical protein